MMAQRRILLTGADGLLGSELRPLLEQTGELFGPGLDTFDLTRPESIRETFRSFRPDLVVHLAAETRVDRCEQHPEEVFRINAQGTARVALACRSFGARLVTLSSDYVFDGAQRTPYREYQTPRPLNVYGRSKEESERAVRRIAGNSLVVRSSSLYGPGGRHFVGAILAGARRGETLRVVADQTQSPTWVGDLAPALARAATSELCGILHLSGEGECTWFEFATAILDAAGLQVACEPISTEEAARPAMRPAYSVLSGELAASELGIRLPHWRKALAAYFAGETVA